MEFTFSLSKSEGLSSANVGRFLAWDIMLMKSLIQRTRTSILATVNLEPRYSQMNASDILEGLTDIVAPDRTLELMLSQNLVQS